jgi:hypothetical protein
LKARLSGQSQIQSSNVTRVVVVGLPAAVTGRSMV